MLANCEEHTSLSRALSQLAETEEKIDLLYQEQANVDFTVLAELLRDYIGLLGTVRVRKKETIFIFFVQFCLYGLAEIPSVYRLIDWLTDWRVMVQLISPSCWSIDWSFDWLILNSIF